MKSTIWPRSLAIAEQLLEFGVERVIVGTLAAEQQCSVLTVMHDLNLAAEYCDRIYLLREGRIEAGGPTEEVFTYANLTRVFETEVYVDTNTLTGKLLRQYSAGGRDVTNCHFHGDYLYTTVAAKEAVFRLKLDVAGLLYSQAQ